MPSRFIRIKSGAVVEPTVIIAIAVVNAANALGLSADMLITSGNDSKHKFTSLHYKDRALDFRTHHLPTNEKHALRDNVKARLGKSFDVILESEGLPNEHLHIEHDPR